MGRKGLVDGSAKGGREEESARHYQSKRLQFGITNTCSGSTYASSDGSQFSSTSTSSGHSRSDASDDGRASRDDANDATDGNHGDEP